MVLTRRQAPRKYINEQQNIPKKSMWKNITNIATTTTRTLTDITKTQKHNNNEDEKGSNLNLEDKKRRKTDGCGYENGGVNNKSGDLSTTTPNKGIFGSGTRYTGSLFLGGFLNIVLSSQQSNMSIFEEQHTSNEEVENEKNETDRNHSLMKEQEVFTGEENNSTQHSDRTKLYWMDGQIWKERGLGILKLNYPINYDKSPRLVMHADNILKVILNIALFRGMHVERSQEKFLRIVAFKGGLLVHLAIKLSNSTAADDLYQTIMDAITPART
ncbi:hypothetical protein Glove_365g200 [Diversispora epigaea]|uniref:RanBD1 domain-containing protein n=1 Tax=Diversispora epigaea TaxID=1348612 RepID=A0A397H824_9GLOM|nr:hypothetical protein Glove_365g200 [Diversispora epigaea]